MPHEIEDILRPTPRPNALSTLLKWLARGLFVAAVLAMGYGLWIRKPAPAAPEQGPAEKPVAIDWSREPFRPWRSVEDGIELTYPARYDETRGFGRFTSRDLQDGLVETDLVAFRSMSPRSVILVATYKAPRTLSWHEWVALAKMVQGSGFRKDGPTMPASGLNTGSPLSPTEPNAQGRTPNRLHPLRGYPGTRRRTPIRPLIPIPQPPTPFSAEFGGSDESYRMTKAGGRDALAVSARGALRFPMRGNERMELWRFESRLVAEGETAVRITAGVPVSQYEGAKVGLEKSLESFRWFGGRKLGNEETGK